MNVSSIAALLIRGGVDNVTADKWAPYFFKYFAKFNMLKPEVINHFLANVLVESNYLKSLRENLNYSAQGLANTWPNRFSSTGRKGGAPNNLATRIARNPEAIANHTYANRMGNGDVLSGDGWKYAGKGPFQLTGKDNYRRFFSYMKLPLDSNPNLLAEPDLGVLSAIWYWLAATGRDLGNFAVKGDIDTIVDYINIGRKTQSYGDGHGFKDRKRILDELNRYVKANPSRYGKIESTSIQAPVTTIVKEPVPVTAPLKEEVVEEVQKAVKDLELEILTEVKEGNTFNYTMVKDGDVTFL